MVIQYTDQLQVKNEKQPIQKPAGTETEASRN